MRAFVSFCPQWAHRLCAPKGAATLGVTPAACKELQLFWVQPFGASQSHAAIWQCPPVNGCAGHAARGEQDCASGSLIVGGQQTMSRSVLTFLGQRLTLIMVMVAVPAFTKPFPSRGGRRRVVRLPRRVCTIRARRWDAAGPPVLAPSSPGLSLRDLTTAVLHPADLFVGARHVAPLAGPGLILAVRTSLPPPARGDWFTACTVACPAGLCVFMADVYMEAPPAGEQGGAPERPQELHRFLVHGPDGRRLESVTEKRCALVCHEGPYTRGHI